MRIFLILLTLIATPAFAQMREIEPPTERDTVRLLPGQQKTFQFNQDVRQIDIPIANIVEATPQSDRVVSFRGLREGQVVVTVRDGNNLIHRFMVSVGSGTVKMYRPDAQDFVLYNCTDRGCGRGDIQPRGQTSVTTRTLPTTDGGYISTTTSNPR